MSVPRVVVGVGDFWPNDFDDTSAGFHQSSGEKATVAKGIFAIGFAGFVALLFESEGFARPSADDEIEGPVVIFIERVVLDRFVDGGHLRIDGRAEAGASFEPQ